VPSVPAELTGAQPDDRIVAGRCVVKALYRNRLCTVVEAGEDITLVDGETKFTVSLGDPGLVIAPTDRQVAGVENLADSYGVEGQAPTTCVRCSAASCLRPDGSRGWADEWQDRRGRRRRTRQRLPLTSRCCAWSSSAATAENHVLGSLGEEFVVELKQRRRMTRTSGQTSRSAYCGCQTQPHSDLWQQTGVITCWSQRRRWFRCISAATDVLAKRAFRG
jgi:hypothetical protein